MACDAGLFSVDCFRELAANTFRELGIYFDLHAFWFYFVLGAIILLIFSRDRLDRYIDPGDQDTADVPNGQPPVTEFEKFVNAFRPSEVCMVRAFSWAWIYYAGVLIVSYSLFAFMIAVALGLIQVPSEFAGILMENLVQPSLDGLAVVVGNTIEPSASVSDPASVTAAAPLDEAVVFKVDEPVVGLEAPAPVQDTTTQLQELPLILALMVVGFLPRIRGINRVETTIRDYSLHFAGIPRKVIVLWQQLCETPLTTQQTDAAGGLTVFESQIAFLPERQQKLIRRSSEFARPLVGDAQFDEDMAALTRVFAFSSWTTHEPTWPPRPVVELYGRGSLQDLQRDILLLEQDVTHFVELNSINTQLTEARESLVAAGGMADAQPQAGYTHPGYTHPGFDPIDVPDTALNPADVMQARWTDLMDRVRTVSDQATAMLALYVERVDHLPSGDPKFDVLCDWVRRARLVDIDESTTSQAVPARFGLAVGAAVILVGIFAFFENYRELPPAVFASADPASLSQAEAAQAQENLITARDTLKAGVVAAVLQALAWFVAAACVLSFVRDYAARKHTWYRFGTARAQASYRKLFFWSFFWGAVFCFIAQAVSLLLALGPAQISVNLDDTFRDLFDWSGSFTLAHVAALGLQTALVACVTAAASDLWCTQRKPIAVLVLMAGAVLFVLAKILELSVSTLLDFWTSTAFEWPSVAKVIGAPERFQLAAFVLAGLAFTLIRMSARRD